jgi:hypothetical protein
MVTKHQFHLNITGFRGQVVLITTGHIGVAGIMVVAVADTVIMDADMVVEDIGAGLARGVVVAEADLVVEAVVEVVEAVVAGEEDTVKKSI